MHKQYQKQQRGPSLKTQLLVSRTKMLAESAMNAFDAPSHQRKHLESAQIYLADVHTTGGLLQSYHAYGEQR